MSLHAHIDADLQFPESGPAQEAERVGASPALGQDLDSSLHVLTCGSVDDGKSTLIGRMLWDSAGVFADQRDAIARQPLTSAGTPDFSLLVDGLAAEREQGITIDIAWRYFDVAARRLVIIDSPGHVQYTRNMATGASHADVAVLLVDARSGIKEQTLRHAAILDLVGVRRVVLAVNKMDLVAWSQERFAAIARDFEALAARFRFVDAIAIPLSAIHGDNVSRRSRPMAWYDGPTLFEHLVRLQPAAEPLHAPFRFPVQLVVRDGLDFRGLAGTVASGEVAVGDEVREGLSGRTARVASIRTMGRAFDKAVAGQAVVLQLDADIDVSRGGVLTHDGARIPAARQLSARLVWLSDAPFDAGRGYLLRTATDLVPVSGLHIEALLDLATMHGTTAAGLRVNDIATVRIELARAVAADRFADLPATGCFVVVDAMTGATVAGGVVDAIVDVASSGLSDKFRLTRAMLEGGLCSDLDTGETGRSEFRRRAQEVSLLLAAAGVSVDLAEIL